MATAKKERYRVKSTAQGDLYVTAKEVIFSEQFKEDLELLEAIAEKQSTAWD